MYQERFRAEQQNLAKGEYRIRCQGHDIKVSSNVQAVNEALLLLQIYNVTQEEGRQEASQQILMKLLSGIENYGNAVEAIFSEVETLLITIL